MIYYKRIPNTNGRSRVKNVSTKFQIGPNRQSMGWRGDLTLPAAGGLMSSSLQSTASTPVLKGRHYSVTPPEVKRLGMCCESNDWSGLQLSEAASSKPPRSQPRQAGP